HLVDAADAAKQLEQAPQIRFGSMRHACDIANPRWPESFGAADQRLNLPPCRLVLRSEANLMARQTDPGAVERNLLGTRQSLQHRGKGRRRQARLQLQSQPLHPDSSEIGILGVECL